MNLKGRCNLCKTPLIDLSCLSVCLVRLKSPRRLRRRRLIAVSPRRPAVPLAARTSRAPPVRPRRPRRTPRLSCRTRLSSGSCSQRSRPRCTSTTPAWTWPRSTRVSSTPHTSSKSHTWGKFSWLADLVAFSAVLGHETTGTG